MLLREAGIVLDGLTSGLVTGSACGCVCTDLSYFRTVLQGQPSPLLFSYTLPNTAPSEAAAYFGLQGPVYAVLDAAAPYEAALSEAVRLLDFIPELDLMIFGTLDVCPGADPAVQLNLIRREAVRGADRSEGGSLGP
jgi:3-oxoacyl-(acyl-carrier-protein) synthase